MNCVPEHDIFRFQERTNSNFYKAYQEGESSRMKKLQIVSMIVLIITIIGFMLWHFVVPFPDCLVRVVGILMLASIFTAVFSTVKIAARRK